MKMYVKPSIEVIELQLKENIAAVPTTVYKGSKAEGFKVTHKEIALTAKTTGLKQTVLDEFKISDLAI